MVENNVHGPLWGVLIGRFQPFHDGHAYLVQQVLEATDGVVIVIGSAFAARSLRNPWSFAERREMLLAGVPEALHPRIRVVGMPDVFYDEARWLRGVVNAVEGAAPDDARICLYGHTKDASSYYLALFPDWEYREEPNYRNLSATPMREAILARDPDTVDALIDLLPDSEMPRGVRDWLKAFARTADYRQLLKEARAIRAFKHSWAGSPYPPMFITVDAMVTWREDVLLIRRGGYPGHGLLALPGGFLDPGERIEAAARRELAEETGLDAGGLAPQQVFVADHPDRSDRGRFVTHVFHFALDPSRPRPAVQGGDDAASADWHALGSLPAAQLFEDHLQILQHMLGTARVRCADIAPAG